MQRYVHKGMAKSSLTATAICRLPALAEARRRGPSGLSFAMGHFAAVLLVVRIHVPTTKRFLKMHTSHECFYKF
jgi:hypothetical protein